MERSLPRREKNQEASLPPNSPSISEKRCSPCRETSCALEACEPIRSYATVLPSAYPSPKTSCANSPDVPSCLRLPCRHAISKVRNFPQRVPFPRYVRFLRETALRMPKRSPSKQAFPSGRSFPSFPSSKSPAKHTRTFSATTP